MGSPQSTHTLSLHIPHLTQLRDDVCPLKESLYILIRFAKATKYRKYKQKTSGILELMHFLNFCENFVIIKAIVLYILIIQDMQFYYIPNLYKGKYTSQLFCGSLPKLVEVEFEHGNM